MPFQSENQRRFLYAKKPEVAKKFEAHSPWLDMPTEEKKDDEFKKASEPVPIAGTN